MRPTGITIHQSVCGAINGKGYDFYVTRSGTIIPATEATDSASIHICVEGDFSRPDETASGYMEEQFFIVQKLVLRLADTFGFDPGNVVPHTDLCPGKHFPWSELVISPKDGYH
ncbi:peptidoglycan recognition protein family protein [Paenibacillus sp. GYB003]|uniref:peptidoglycan recognition protein family protein n=1 Tax=Paenibacillus sp. GYB003 TaxID=2994392 RepID=UPI002F96267C